MRLLLACSINNSNGIIEHKTEHHSMQLTTLTLPQHTALKASQMHHIIKVTWIWPDCICSSRHIAHLSCCYPSPKQQVKATLNMIYTALARRHCF